MQDIIDAIKANDQKVQTLLADTRALVDKLITLQQLKVQALHIERERAEDKTSIERRKYEHAEEAARALFRALGWEKPESRPVYTTTNSN